MDKENQKKRDDLVKKLEELQERTKGIQGQINKFDVKEGKRLLAEKKENVGKCFRRHDEYLKIIGLSDRGELSKECLIGYSIDFEDDDLSIETNWAFESVERIYNGDFYEISSDNFENDLRTKITNYFSGLFEIKWVVNNGVI